MRTKLAAVGLAAGLTAGGLAGLVLAVPAVSGAQSSDTTVAEGDASTGRSRPEPGTRIAEALAPLVTDGTLTQEQADKVVETLRDALPRGGHGPGRGVALEAAAGALGMTEDELRDALRDGQTIAEVAAARGVDVQAVIDALVAEAEAHLAEKVADGTLTREQADERLAEMTERLTTMVDEGLPAGGGHSPGGRGGPGGHGDAPTEDGDGGTTEG